MNLINLLKSLGTYVNVVKHLNQLMKYRFANSETLKLSNLQYKKEEPLQNYCITFSYWKYKVSKVKKILQKLKNQMGKLFSQRY